MSITVRELSTTRPEAVKVFQRHGIDFCCGGGRTLTEACLAKGVDPSGILDEIAAEESRTTTPAIRWDRVPLAELIDHILDRYHEPLKEDLPRLEAMARRVLQVHGHKDEDLEPLLAIIVALRADLEPHMEKEERILFPWIRSGRGATAQGPIAVMLAEHDDVAALLVDLRTLTKDFEVPEGACATWTALWRGLEALDRDLREHIALENNVLFPGAFATQG